MYFVSIADIKLQKAACLFTGLCYHRAMKHPNQVNNYSCLCIRECMARIDAAHDGMYLLHHYPVCVAMEVRRKKFFLIIIIRLTTSNNTTRLNHINLGFRKCYRYILSATYRTTRLNHINSGFRKRYRYILSATYRTTRLNHINSGFKCF